MRKRNAVGGLFLSLALASCYGSDPVGYEFSKQEGDGELGIWVHSGLYNRSYELHTPPNVGDGALHPVIIFLHGSGDSGPSFRRTLNADAATDAGGFITLWPSGMQGTWTVGCGYDCTLAEVLGADDVTFLATLVRQVAAELPVDTTRVYLLGYAQGGQLAQVYGCQSPLPPAGIGVVAAEIYRLAALRCAPQRTFPIGILHGDSDPIAVYAGFGPGAVVLSAVETVQSWLDRFHCLDNPSEQYLPDVVGDFTSARVYRFSDCDPGARVAFYRVYEGGHTWPGDTGPWSGFVGLHSRNIDATAEFLSLFASMAQGAAGS